MRRPLDEATAPATTALALVVGALLAVLPAMPVSPTGAPEATAVVLTLVLVSLFRRKLHRAVPGALGESCASPDRRTPLLALSGRVTDPAHHPIRPRAPGLA